MEVTGRLSLIILLSVRVDLPLGRLGSTLTTVRTFSIVAVMYSKGSLARSVTTTDPSELALLAQ